MLDAINRMDAFEALSVPDQECALTCLQRVAYLILCPPSVQGNHSRPRIEDRPHGDDPVRSVGGKECDPASRGYAKMVPQAGSALANGRDDLAICLSPPRIDQAFPVSMGGGRVQQGSKMAGPVREHFHHDPIHRFGPDLERLAYGG